MCIRDRQYTIREWPSFNAMLEGYYAEKDRAERLRTKSKDCLLYTSRCV